MPTISKAKLKQYQQLHSKKFRQKYGQFIVEGIKSVHEVDQSDWPVECILCTTHFAATNDRDWKHELVIIDDVDFGKTSLHKNPQEVLAVLGIQSITKPERQWQLALSGINDPGNLGTIIRTAEWYGISHIYCSLDCVDLFNPKVIQATMGSFLRMQIEQVDLAKKLEGKKVYSAMLNGKNIREMSPEAGVILVGSEANGIPPDLLKSLDYEPITIPGNGLAESLNAAIATAVCLERLTIG